MSHLHLSPSPESYHKTQMGDWYDVSYTPKGGMTSFAKLKNDTTCKLIDLKPFTVYYIYVRAKTAVGFGDRSVLLTVSTSDMGT